MKKTFLFFALAGIISLGSCKQEEKAEIDEANLAAAAEQESAEDNTAFPVMEFEEQEYDFGTVQEGEIVEHEYTFTNTGDAPLVIVDAKGSCGCTVPTWTKEPVAPGESGNMMVRFNTTGKPNSQTKTVTIKANTKEGTESIRIKGMVTPKAEAQS